jgi:cystathionine gamma-synthase
MGVLAARDGDLLKRLAVRRTLLGAAPGPLETFLALRGLRTLPLRVERGQHNAGELARRLTTHPAVERVRYPGLPDDPGHARAAAQMSGFGAMLAFDLRGGEAKANALCANVRLITHATSLGGVESTLERRGRYHGEEAVPSGLVRLSVGCEHVDDLWADLCAALDAV